jgi:ribulose-5-phosphate 4-epimerase/fuculose-1-phosphate aldolase
MDDNPIAFRAAAEAPVFDDAEAHRRHVRTRLAAGFRLLARLDLNIGVAGHVSARDPVQTDHFWVNPFGVPYCAMRADDLALVRHDGVVVHGAAINAAAFAIHAEIHRARPEVMCAAHGHPVHGTAWAALARPLAPINQDVCAFFEDHVVFDEPMGLVLGMDEGRRIAAALAGHKAAILRNHGLLTVGRTVDEAIWWFALMDRCCRIQLLAESAGTPHALPAEQARDIARQIGTSGFGWFQCQPLLAGILDDNPSDDNAPAAFAPRSIETTGRTRTP